jgi:hypothetical protein
MAEPTSTAAGATLVAAAASVPVLSLAASSSLVLFGVPLELRIDVLMAGFGGALAGVILLNTVPATDDTWRDLLRSTLKRMGVTIASSLTAGYLVPLVLLLGSVPPSLMLAFAFVVGAGAQKILARYVMRVAAQAAPAEQGGAP